MNIQNATTINTSPEAAKQSVMHRMGEWIQDPMGGVIAASVATIGSFGVVLSGMWFIGLAVNQ